MFQFPFVNELLFYFIAYILPGAILGLGLFKNKNILDRIILGIPLSMFITTLISFLITLFVFPFSQTTLYISLFLTYLISVASILLSKNNLDIGNFWEVTTNNPYGFLISLVAVGVALLSFYIRIQPISPIYYELDPYYYLYSAFQLITTGNVPFQDTTAWYPNFSTHRVVPLLTHFYALPYEFLFGSNMDIFKLSYSANFYPPFVFALMLLLFYVLFRNLYNNKAALLAIIALSFNDMFLIKSLSGVFEAQPMGFLLLTYSLVMIVFSFKKMDKSLFYVLGIALSYTYLASNFGFIAFGLFSLVSLIYSFYLFFKMDKENLSLLKSYLLISVLILILLFSLYSIFYKERSYTSTSFIKTLFMFLVPLIFSYLLDFILKNYSSLVSKYKVSSSVALVLLFLIFFLSPFGKVLRAPIESAFSITQYNTVLERTIAEQQQIGASIVNYVGSFGKDEPNFINVIFSSIFNIIFMIIYSFLDLIGMHISYIPKNPSWALTIITISLIVLIFRVVYGFLKGKMSFLPLFILTFFFVMGGMLKSKYGILLSYAFLISFAVFLAEFLNIPYYIKYALKKFGKKNKKGNKGVSEFEDERTYDILSIFLFFSLLFFLLSLFYSSTSYSILAISKYTKFSENPYQFKPLLNQMCAINSYYCEDIENFSSKIENQFDGNLCVQSLAQAIIKDYGSVPNNLKPGLSYTCMVIPRKWITAMEFINTTEKGSRVISWWDYGHWINYFGQRNAVIRNEHSYLNMILEVADAYIMENETTLKRVMNKYGSKYALIDDEIILSQGTIFGGKFYALNYLACSYNNLTNVFTPQLNSMCEHDNLWEIVQVSPEECTISKVSGLKGNVAYRISYKKYPSGIRQYPEKAYCFGKATLADGNEINALYYLNETNEAGDLKLNKGFLAKTSQDGVYVVLYTKDKVWNENGNVVDGWEDRKGRFYDSVVYKGFILGHLDGFEKVFDNGQIKIYKISS